MERPEFNESTICIVADRSPSAPGLKKLSNVHWPPDGARVMTPLASTLQLLSGIPTKSKAPLPVSTKPVLPLMVSVLLLVLVRVNGVPALMSPSVVWWYEMLVVVLVRAGVPAPAGAGAPASATTGPLRATAPAIAH